MIFFLNSKTRIYNDTELNQLSRILFSNGVFNTKQSTMAIWKESGDFSVDASGESMTVSAKAGVATVAVMSEGKVQQAIINEASPITAIVANNPSLAVRNDTVVLRVLQSVINSDSLNEEGSNAVSLVVVSGNGANPLTDSEISLVLGGDPFVKLANILVPMSATSITQSMVTDKRSIVNTRRSFKFASDVFKFYALAEDPSQLEQGDVWFNSTQGLFKIFDGKNSIALNESDFDWGYYPPGGIDSNAAKFDAVAENDSDEGTDQLSFYYLYSISGGVFNTLWAAQVFEMPDVENPYVSIKMANVSNPTDLEIAIYNVDGSNVPTTQIETAAAIPASEIPNGGYVNAYLDGSLYTPGTKYAIVLKGTKQGYVDNPPTYIGWVATALYESDETFFGTISGNGSTWGGLNSNINFVMKIAERDEVRFGETDTTGKRKRICQVFNPKFKDMTAFVLTRGENIGTPTGDINVSLYIADQNGNPSGNILASASVSQSDWNAVSPGEGVEIPLMYDSLVIGQNYAAVIDTEYSSNDNNYTLYFGATPNGYAKYYNTSDGWVAMGGDVFYGLMTSPVNKILVMNGQGKIDEDILPVRKPRVLTIASSATPFISVETYDCINITALAANISDLSANIIGTPYNFQRIIWRIKDNGSSRTINPGNKIANTGATFITATTAGKTHTITTEYNEVIGKHCCIDAKVEA